MTTGQDEIIARMASHHEAQTLDLPPGVPVLEVLHTSFDQDSEPFEVSRFVHLAGTLAGKSLGTLVPGAKSTDCRAMGVGPKGTMWAAITESHSKVGQLLHLVSYRSGDKAPREHDPVSVSNPNFTEFVDKNGKPLPFHGGLFRRPDGVTTPRYVVLGVCEGRDGSVYALMLHPYTVLQVGAEQLE